MSGGYSNERNRALRLARILLGDCTVKNHVLNILSTRLVRDRTRAVLRGTGTGLLQA